MRRRDLLAALPVALTFPTPAPAQSLALSERMRRRAKALAALPYSPPVRALPAALANLDYDAYRDLRYRPDRAVWRELGLPFQLQMFARSGSHADRVEISEAVEGVVQPIAYRPDLFTAGPLVPGALAPDLGFAGFRIHALINDPGRFDEFAVFLGASYFRAVPQGGAYGLSARGIEVGSGDEGEEFPAFRSFIIERPVPDAPAITVHALLDGPSVAGAYRFVIAPGEATVFDVTATLFPRRDLANVGIAPLTSMFLFGADRPGRFDDFRPEVHDSDGLLVEQGPDSRLWRPLINPDRVEISVFDRPGGFGLLQRTRGIDAYQDLEANYHQRPGAWVEPLRDWGRGAARLVELPTRLETEDNIVASWRPTTPLKAGQEHRFDYRLHWSASPSPLNPLAQTTLWRSGAAGGPRHRRFVVEFSPLDRAALSNAALEVTASAGRILHPTLQANDFDQAARVSFVFDPGEASASDLTARLSGPAGAFSETWRTRWRA